MAVLLRLDDGEVKALTVALEEIPETVHLKNDIAAAVAPKLPNLNSQQVEQLVAALYSLFEVRALADLSVESFVEDLASAMFATGRSDLALKDESRKRFLANMASLLEVKSLVLLAKVNSLQREHEHIFHDARILTDLRPVFSAPDQEPDGMIIEHKFKVHFHDGSRHKELYMTLDMDDIVRLRKTIERAEAKAATLSALMASKGIKQLYLS